MTYKKSRSFQRYLQFVIDRVKVYLGQEGVPTLESHSPTVTGVLHGKTSTLGPNDDLR